MIFSHKNGKRGYNECWRTFRAPDKEFLLYIHNLSALKSIVPHGGNLTSEKSKDGKLK